MIRSRGEAVRDTTRWEHTIICKSYVLADMDIKYLTRFSRQISDSIKSKEIIRTVYGPWDQAT